MTENTPTPITHDSHPVKPLRERVIETLKTCYDPEIPVDIYELGLIYGSSNFRTTCILK
jgi:metal-sulfur cluster biosynthetic enzyme